MRARADWPVNEKQTYFLWKHREELASEFDAWEVASGIHLYPQVLESKLPKIANSDFHHPRHFASWKSVFACERHPEAILDAIRKQNLDYRFFTGVKTYDSHKNNSYNRLGRRLPAYAFRNRPFLKAL